MIPNWSDSKRKGMGNLSQKIFEKVKPSVPLKNKLKVTQSKLESQITKLDGIYEKLHKKDVELFQIIKKAVQDHDNETARSFAIELHEIRKVKRIVDDSRLSMKQIHLRLSTISEVGDIVVSLSPCMSLIKGINTSLGGIIPAANDSIQDLSDTLGEILSSSSMTGDENIMNIMNDKTLDTIPGDNPETRKILDQASDFIQEQLKTTIPEVPNSLKDEIMTSDVVRTRDTTKTAQQLV